MSASQLTPRHRLLLIGGAALVAIVAAGVFGHKSIQQLQVAHRWVGHSHEVLRSIEKLRGRVSTAKVHHRGAFVTATRDFILRHDSLMRETIAGIDDVRRLTRDNPVQQRRLDSLHTAVTDLVASSHHVWDLQLASAEPDDVLQHGAKIEEQFTQIASVVERLEREEESLLAARTAVAEAAGHWARAVIIISLLIAAVFVALALSPLYRALQKSRTVQKALAASEARYRQLMEGAADAILIVANGRCVEANTEATNLFGLSSDDLSGKTLGDLIVPDDGGALEAFASLSPGATVSGEFTVRHSDGVEKPVEISAAAFEQEILQLIIRDISDRKQVERLKDQFVSVVSHELRTPLTALSGSIRLLQSPKIRATPAQQERLLSLAGSNAERLVRLVNDILEFERFTSGGVPLELSDTDLHLLALEVVENLRPLSDEADVELRVEGASVSASVDRVRISQVLTNLVGNAIKFSPAHTVVDVALDATDGVALITVRDRGRGIPADQLESVFERFHQVDKSDARQKGGTGLGLAISRQIVQQHGGEIWAESDGTGSAFHVRLPMAVPAETA